MFIPLMMAVTLGMPGDDKPADVKILGRGNWKAPARMGATAQQVVIRTGDEFTKAIDAKENPQTAIENLRKTMKVDIDWDKHMLVVVTGGVQRTGGYRIEITDIKSAGDTMTVHWKLHTPAPGSLTTSALTHPAEVVLVDKFAGKVVFDPPVSK